MSWVLNALQTAHQGLIFFAPHTPIKTDDAAVVLIDAIMSDAALFNFTTTALDVVDALPIPRDFEGKELPVYARKAELDQLPKPAFPKSTIDLLHSKGFEVQDFMEFLPAIIQFIQLFRKKRKD